MKKLLALSLLALLSVALFSPITAHCPEATGRRPLWIEKLPNNTNDSYFEVIRAEGRTLEQARENAGTEIFTRQADIRAERDKFIATTMKEHFAQTTN